MARFHPNQQVVCIAKSLSYEKGPSWWEFWRRRTPIGPKYNEIVTIESYHGIACVYLKEYRHLEYDGFRARYRENIFEPLVSDEELYKALKEETTTA